MERHVISLSVYQQGWAPHTTWEPGTQWEIRPSGHSLVSADLQITAVWEVDSTRWPEVTPFKRALIQVASLFPLSPFLGESQAFPLFSQTFPLLLSLGHLYLKRLLLFIYPVVSETPWTATCQILLSLTISWSLPKFMSIALVMPSSHLILYHPLLLLPSILPRIRDFSSESAVAIRWSINWALSFSIIPSNKDSGLISLKIDWFDLLVVQATLRSLHQHHNSKAKICGTLSSLWSTSHNHTWPLGRP